MIQKISLAVDMYNLYKHDYFHLFDRSRMHNPRLCAVASLPYTGACRPAMCTGYRDVYVHVHVPTIHTPLALLRYVATCMYSTINGLQARLFLI